MSTKLSAPAPRHASREARSPNPAGIAELGLSAAEAARRLVEDGPNALPGGKRRSLWSIAADTLREPMFVLLLAAGTLYLVFGDLQEGLTLLVSLSSRSGSLYTKRARPSVPSKPCAT